MKKIFAPLLLVLLLFATYSCMDDREMDDASKLKDKNAEVVLRLKTPSDFTPSSSRSLTYKDENTIKDIYVLVFDKSNELVAIEKGDNVSSSQGNTNPSYSGKGSFTVTLKASKTTVDTYQLVVLANAQTIITNTIGFNLSSISNKAYSAVMARLWEQITSKMYAVGGTIPMWGESGQLVIAPGNSTQTLQLIRSVARIDVGVGAPTKNGTTDAWTWNGKNAANATIPFVLKNVYVIRPNNRYMVAPTTAGSLTVPTGTTAFSFTDSESRFAFAATTSSTGGYTSRDIYVPEADTKMTTSGSVGDANHTNRMAIVVGGYYNGNTTETFYRLDFNVGGNLVNVLRNHLYQFNISSVAGDGFVDVETAYNSLPMNMKAEILAWDETDMGNIAFDGQHTLSVSQDNFSFDRDPISSDQSDNVFHVFTDYTIAAGTSGWYVEKIVNATNGTTPVTWVKTTTNGTAPLTAGVANVKAKIVLAIDANNTSSTRSAIVWVAAGRLRYPVTVTQTNTNAVGIQTLDGNNKEIMELLFDGKAFSSQTLTVKWAPKSYNLIVTNSAVGGTNAFVAPGAPTSGTVTGGTGSVSYTFKPNAFTAAEVSNNPFLEKASMVEFVTSNGSTFETANVFLRQINYNLVTDVQGGYMLDSKTKSIKVQANFGWTITAVKDVDDILQNENALINKIGGHNTTIGDIVSFTMQSSTSLKAGKTATITFTSHRDGSTYDVVITALDALYIGYFGGKLVKNATGEWQFEKSLYAQSENESNSVTWAVSTGVTGVASDWDGKDNTLKLNKLSTVAYPAATLCIKKNNNWSTITNTTDTNYDWYLPAQKQLMAVWVAHAGFESTYKFNTSYYWSSTEKSASNSWFVIFSNGNTNSSYSSKVNTNRVRCVRDL